MSRINAEWRTVLALFLGVFIIHLASGVTAGGDSRWVVPTAVSIYQHGDTDLNEYPNLLTEWDNYWIDLVDGHHFSRFPIGPALLALPFVYSMDTVMTWTSSSFTGLEETLQRKSPGLPEDADMLDVTSRFESVPTCFYVALAAVLIYLLGRQTLERRRALLLALLFAFATSAWSCASRAMLQHGPIMCVLTLTLWLFIKAEKRPWLVQFAGAILTFGYVTRPTASIPLGVLSLYVVLKHRRYVIHYGI
jgi:dolichyl-phosphate-mannose-protein mannosyltransferase